MERQILHVDVNNAFLSWTAVNMLKNGYKIDIRNIPAVIGGDEETRRGIVLAKSNIAKAVGVKTGETLYSARKKCANLQVFPSNHKMYAEYSEKMYKLLLEYTDEIERFSVDECFLDLTHFIRDGETLLGKASEISKRIKEELGFTVNVGVSTNKLLAKMASDFEKPDKIHTLYPNEIEKKMWPLDIGDLFMVGRKSVPKFNAIGIFTIGDLARADKFFISKRFGKFGKMVWEYANGIDDSEVHFEHEKPKGIGNSITLPYDISNIEKLDEVLLALCEQVCYRLRKVNMFAETVSVQIKTKNFEVFSKQKKLDFETDSTIEIYKVAKILLAELKMNYFIRLVGVRVDNLVEKESMQTSLFMQNTETKQNKLDKVVDMLKEKYGYNLVTRASKINVDDILNCRSNKDE